jgi:hypothetical protein
LVGLWSTVLWHIDVMGLYAGEYINRKGKVIGHDGIDDERYPCCYN